MHLKHLLTTLLLMCFFVESEAQNKVGIGTSAPVFTLDVQETLHCFGRFKAGSGYAGIILEKASDNSNAYVIHRTGGVDKWTAGTMGNNHYKITNWSKGSDALTIDINSNYTGVGVADPAFRLDVGGRMRLRSGDGSAGLWFNNDANTASIGFFGVYNDNHVGLWGNTGIGWSVLMNTDNGFLGIKNGDPQSELHVIHGIGSGASYGIRVQNSGSNNQQWALYTVNGSGNLELYHNGIFRGSFDQGSGAYTASSDLRLKKNIQSPGEVLNNLMELGVKKYQFTGSATNRQYLGLIAQQVETLFPELVFHNRGDDGSEYYTMDYGAVGVVAIKGLQELKQQFDKQQTEIALLQQQNKLLQQQISELKNLFAGQTGVIKIRP